MIPLKNLILLSTHLHLPHLLPAIDISFKFFQHPLPAKLQVILPKGVPLVHLPLPVVVQPLQLLDRAVLVLLDELYVVVLSHRI
jgi:hypothetical protein